MGTKKNYGILEIFLGIFVFSVGLTISILPSFADIYPGTLNATYAPNLQPAWVNLSKGDLFFANGNEVFIIINFSCSPPSVCNQTMTITADFSEIGGSQNREGVFRFKDAGNTWAVFEVNDTINFSAIGGQPIMINPKNITFNATDGNVSNSYYNDTAFLTIGLVNVSYPVGCPPPDAPLPDTIPLLNGTLVNVRSCITTCTVNDRAQQYNDTHYDICGPNFGGDTTNFTELAGTGNFSNFNLTLTTFNGAGAFMGKINFLQNITLIGEQNPFSIFEFAAMSIMCGGKIGINETEWNGSATKPNLNLTARLTINTTGLGISGRPQIIRTAHSESLLTGRACPPSICSNVVWDGENISFTVSTWSDYGVSDAINVSLQSPGNFTYSSDQIINFTFLPTWEDTAIVKNCTLYGNFTGVWAANGSDTSIVKDSINGIINTVPSDGDYIWNIYCYNDSSNYDLGEANWTVTVDTFHPKWSNPNFNNTIANKPTNFTLTWTDTNLANYIFSTNNSGTWVNSTPVQFSGADTSWNVTTLNDTGNSVIAWRFYANDSAGNWNMSRIFTFITSPDYCNIVIANGTLPYDLKQSNTYYCLNESIGKYGADGIVFAYGVQNSTLDCLDNMIRSNSTANTAGINITSLSGNATKNNTIKNCSIRNYHYGIFFNTVPLNNTIENNTLRYNKWGIYLNSSNNTVVIGNTICYNNIGVYNNTIENTIDNNTFCVAQIYPADDIWYSSVSRFEVNVSNSIFNSSCQLYVDNLLAGANYSVFNNNLTTISNSSLQGAHIWYVYCNDSVGTNWGNSSVSSFGIKKSDSSSCTADYQCSGGYCCSNVCQSTACAVTTTTTAAPSYFAPLLTTTTTTTTTTTIPRTEEMELLENVGAGDNATFEFDESNTLKIENVKITTKHSLRFMAVTIKESSLPSGASAPLTTDTGDVYKYVEIAKDFFTDDNMTKATIKFKVEKSWITSNGIDKNTVKLYRYSNGSWEGLETRLSEEGTDYIHYEAYATKLSIFAIAGLKTGAQETIGTTTTSPGIGITLPPFPKLETPQIIIIAAIIIVAVVLILIKLEIIEIVQIKRIKTEGKKRWKDFQKKRTKITDMESKEFLEDKEEEFNKK